MNTLFQDMRYGLRLLLKSPGFTIVAVLSLALGVGANTATFSIVNSVLLRSLPFSHPDRLVKIMANNRGVGAQDIGFSVPELDDLRTRAGVFDQVTATQRGPTNLTGANTAIFSIVNAVLLRSLPFSHPDRLVKIVANPYTIVGVLPPGFRHPGSTVTTHVEVWTTAGYRADRRNP